MRFIFLLFFLVPLALMAQQINTDSTSICMGLSRDIDDFTHEIKFTMPYYDCKEMQIIKYLKKGGSTYYLSLDATGSTYVTDAKGVIIIFKDGTRWSRSAKIDNRINGSDIVYSCFITLTPADLKIFSTKAILKYRLYIFDFMPTSEAADKFVLYSNCIKNAK